MKTIKLIIILLTAGIVSFACEHKMEATGPGKLTNVEFHPLQGAGYFTYTLPKESNMLYVKAVYTIDNGEQVTKTSSKYTDSLYVEGFLKNKPYNIDLYTVNVNNVATHSQTVEVIPLESSINDVLASVSVHGSVKCLYIDVENPNRQKTKVFLTLQSDTVEVFKVFMALSERHRFMVMPLDAVEYKVSVFTADMYNNKTEIRDMGVVTPQDDIAIDKSKWTILADEFIPDEINETHLAPEWQKNCSQGWYGMYSSSLWDNTIDRGDGSYSFYHAEPAPPYSYYIDLGQTIQASRITTWQRRSHNVSPWGNHNVREYELYASNDKDFVTSKVVNWFRLGRYTLIKPDSEAEASKVVEDGSTFMIDPETYGFSAPFRYLRFRPLALFGDAQQSSVSELTLYGKEME